MEGGGAVLLRLLFARCARLAPHSTDHHVICDHSVSSIDHFASAIAPTTHVTLIQDIARLSRLTVTTSMVTSHYAASTAL